MEGTAHVEAACAQRDVPESPDACTRRWRGQREVVDGGVMVDFLHMIQLPCHELDPLVAALQRSGVGQRHGFYSGGRSRDGLALRKRLLVHMNTQHSALTWVDEEPQHPPRKAAMFLFALFNTGIFFARTPPTGSVFTSTRPASTLTSKLFTL